MVDSSVLLRRELILRFGDQRKWKLERRGPLTDYHLSGMCRAMATRLIWSMLRGKTKHFLSRRAVGEDAARRGENAETDSTGKLGKNVSQSKPIGHLPCAKYAKWGSLRLQMRWPNANEMRLVKWEPDLARTDLALSCFYFYSLRPSVSDKPQENCTEISLITKNFLWK